MYHAAIDVSNCLRRASLKTNVDDEWVLDRLKLRIAKEQEVSSDPVLSLFADQLLGIPIALDYTLTSDEHPLGWVLTQQDLKDYNVMFILLLNLKRAQWRLRDSWFNRHDLKAVDGLDYRKLYVLRHALVHFVDACYSYLQVDVVAPHFKYLISTLENMSTSTKINQKDATFNLSHTHQRLFMQSMLKRSFVSMRPILESLRDVLDVASSVYFLMKGMDDMDKADMRLKLASLSEVGLIFTLAVECFNEYRNLIIRLLF